ncbi:InlB B-repeat-containing protein [Pontibacter pamirensis]|uniref:InlB B-repeat-containing protein n=1 Tax=Pontibacter pamirensis TaxID=2562824 RepID=UPI001389438F|nr:malectin domain-containing carbohydrate-binding protein [Pontibacter pamirensis]
MDKIYTEFTLKICLVSILKKWGVKLLQFTIPVLCLLLLQPYVAHAHGTLMPALQPAGEFISDITASSGKAYTETQLAVGVNHYTDRTYQVTSLPSSLAGTSLIRTANDDKKSTSTNLLSFNLSQNATVYVAYDPRASALPSWLSGWQKLTDRVGVNDAKIGYMELYSKTFPAGTVTLGGNLQSPAAGAQNNYFVIAKEAATSMGLVSSVTASSSLNYILADLAVGVNHYTDRTYQVTSLPSSLAGTSLIRTANDDKKSTSTNLLSFNLSQNATVYVAYDPRASALPSWLSGWQKLTDRVGVDDAKIGYMELYSKTFPAGTVTLGGNLQSPAAGAQNNYFVIAKAEQDQHTGYNLAVSVSGSGTVIKNPDQTTYSPGTSVSLTATAASGYAFSGWSGDASGTVNPLSVTMDGNKSITASFTPTNPGSLAMLLFTPTSTTVNLPSGQQKELKVNLNNSDEDPVVVQLTATEENSTNAPNWLLYGDKPLSEANNLTYNLGESGNEVVFTINATTLAAGTYTATVKAAATGFTPAELVVTLEVDSYEEGLRPYVTAVRPADGAISVSLGQSISVDVRYPSGKSIDGNTVNPSTVKLYKVEGTTKTEVTGTAVNATAAGDAITLSASLALNTTYEFFISEKVKDGNGYMMKPFTSRFKTISSTSDIPTDLEGIAFKEQILVDNSFGSDGFTSLVVGPDHKLYATTSGGKIERWNIEVDGTLTNNVTISPFGASRRLLIGFRFDPSASENKLIAWISHSSPEFTNAPDWAGKLSQIDLSNPSSPQVTDYVINLPRSFKDHATNGIDFGPDGALYFLQGGNTAMGAPDAAWGFRQESLLSAAVLRLDVQKAQQLALPLDAKTAEGGTYNPKATNAPLTVYASGIRNAYDLVWHSNGQLYVPTNGSAAGGNTLALKSGSVWSNGEIYTGPDVPAMSDVRLTQSDYLFRIEKDGYYGHPNVTRNEYIMNGGNPTAAVDPGEITWTENGEAYGYPVGTPQEPSYKGWAFDFGLNKSPNGVIEYKSSAFEGKLQGKLLVCRFSGGDDIIVLEPGTSNLDIIRATEGSEVPGLRRPYANPLDVIEDTRTGNLYISEYFDGNGDGQPRITLLRVGQAETEPQIAVKLINAGGNQLVDSQSRTWSEDIHFSGGITSSKTFDVVGTTDDELYRNYRYASSGAPFSYSLPMSEAGTYTVKLHFLEPYFGAPGGGTGRVGARVFHVDIEGQRVLNNYDILAQKGAGQAVVKTFYGINVTDGSLDLLFTSVRDNAIISAIEITKASTPINYALNVNATGSGTVSKSPNQDSYAAGTSVTLTATPAAGYEFAGWLGGATGLENPLTLTMDGDKSITATFNQVQQTYYTLTVGMEGNGTVTRSPDQESYEAGTTVTLTATPATGYRFTGWSGGATGTENPVTVTMDDDKSVKANFEVITNLNTMLVNAGGAQHTDVDGKSWSADVHFSGGVTSSKTFDVAGTTDDELYRNYRYASSGAPFSYSLPMSEAGTYTVKLHFLEPYFGAPGGGTGKAGARIFHVDIEGQRVLSNYDIYAQDGAGKAIIKIFDGVNISDGELNIDFSSVKDNAIISAIEITKASTPTNYALNVNATGSGTVIRSPDQDSYAAGTSVTLTATPAAGYEFAGWLGGATGLENPLTLTMDSDKSITATFTQVQQTSYTLTVGMEGSGTVTRSPELDSYEAGTTVTLTATSATGYRFTGWSSDVSGRTNPLVVTMDSDKMVTAHFEPEPYFLTVEAGVGGLTSNSPSKTAYGYGDEVSITAIPEPGYEFVEWTGDITGTSNPLEITVTESITIKANFRLKQYVLTTNAGPGGSVSTDPALTSYAYGAVVTLTATPDADSQFSGWSGDVSGTLNTVTITMDSDKSVTANFTAKVMTSSTVRINAGGPAKEISGMIWTGCPDAAGCNNYVTGGNSYVNTSTTVTGIPQYMDQEIFQTGWENTVDTNQEINSTAFTYNIPVTSGDYLVRLYFVELDNISEGQRVFDVNIEGGINELSSLDIVKEAGLKTVLMREIPVTITDGNITIDFNRQVNTPTISAIEIVPASAGSLIGVPTENSLDAMSITAYPNPNPGDIVYVDLANFGQNEVISLSIYSVSGLLVHEQKTETDALGKASIEMRPGKKLSMGVYIIRAISPTGTSNTKLSIQ